MKFTITGESITCVHNGQVHTVQKGTVNHLPLRNALLAENWAEAEKYLTVTKGIEVWAKGSFSVKNGAVYYLDQPLPAGLNTRIVAMAAKNEDPSSLLRFWERLQKNPSFRSVQQLWSFLDHEGIPITEDGYFLAYKAVNSNWMDFHSGKVSNRVGESPSLPRNQISDDPREACHFGLHVGALKYASTFGDSSRKMVIVQVDPEDVVCVPYDHDAMKMRVCKYTVIGVMGAEMSSTVYKEETDKDFETRTDDVLGWDDKDDDWDDEDDDWDDEDLDDDDDDPEDIELGPFTKTIPRASKKSRSSGYAEPVVTDQDLEDLYQELDKKSPDQLTKIDLSTLRKYAAKHLHILGASKIPGGKEALIKLILTTRM